MVQRAQTVREFGLGLVAAGTVLTGLSCSGGDITQPTTGSLEITTATSGPGPALDPDGYTVSVDNGAGQAIGINASVTVSALSLGSHTATLAGLAPNCTVDGATQRPVTIAAGATASVSFAITCTALPPTAGTIAVTTATTGSQPDPDGYTLSLDGAAGQPIGVNATLTISAVASGTHAILLAGLAPNCLVQGENPRSVLVSVGATATVSLAITCSGATGSIHVTTATTGSTVDPDGYTVSVDGGTGQAIGINATLDVTSLMPGTHSVRLAGIASNCRVQGENPRRVTVAGPPASAGFSLSCFTHWTHMASGTTNNLVNISGSSARDIFVVDQAGAIRHYDGVSWTPQSAPVSVSQVWAKSTGDAFATGKTNDGKPTLLHYDGQQWSVVFSPPIPPGLENHKLVWGDIWGTGTDVFAVGGWHSLDGVTDPSGYVVHYDGTAWSSDLCCGKDVILPNAAAGPPVLNDVWGSSKDDVYLIGTEGEYGVILHKNGNAWVRVFEYIPANFNAIWGSSASDVYVSASSIERHSPTLWHFNGTSWEQYGWVYGGEGAIWGSSADDIYVIGGGLIHFGGGISSTVLNGGFSDIWGSSSTDVYVVGTNGTILHGTP